MLISCAADNVEVSDTVIDSVWVKATPSEVTTDRISFAVPVSICKAAAVTVLLVDRSMVFKVAAASVVSVRSITVCCPENFTGCSIK